MDASPAWSPGHVKLTDMGVAKVIGDGTWGVIVDEKVVGFTRKGEISCLTNKGGGEKTHGGPRG